VTAAKYEIIGEPFGYVKTSRSLTSSGSFPISQLMLIAHLLHHRILCPTFGRISFAVYMLRLIGPVKLQRWTLYYCIWVAIAVNALTVILIFPQCQPYTKLWNRGLPGSCWPEKVPTIVGYVQGGE